MRMSGLKLNPMKKLFFLHGSFFPFQFQRRHSSGPKSIIYRKCGKVSDASEVSKFLLNNFYKYEPIGVVLGLDPSKEVKDWFPGFLKQTFASSPPVSCKAIDEATGKMVGVNFAIVIDPKRSPPPSMLDFVEESTHPVKYEICKFLDEITEGLNAAELLGIKSLSTDDDPKSLEHAMLSIHKDYWGQGITQALIAKSEEFAKDKDCLTAKVVATSHFSYLAYLKQGYQVVREFQYEKYHNEKGRNIFSDKMAQLGLHTVSRVMIKDLSPTEKEEK